MYTQSPVLERAAPLAVSWGGDFLCVAPLVSKNVFDSGEHSLGSKRTLPFGSLSSQNIVPYRAPAIVARVDVRYGRKALGTTGFGQFSFF